MPGLLLQGEQETGLDRPPLQRCLESPLRHDASRSHLIQQHLPIAVIEIGVPAEILQLLTLTIIELGGIQGIQTGDRHQGLQLLARGFHMQVALLEVCSIETQQCRILHRQQLECIVVILHLQTQHITEFLQFEECRRTVQTTGPQHVAHHGLVHLPRLVSFRHRQRLRQGVHLLRQEIIQLPSIESLDQIVASLQLFAQAFTRPFAAIGRLRAQPGAGESNGSQGDHGQTQQTITQRRQDPLQWRREQKERIDCDERRQQTGLIHRSLHGIATAGLFMAFHEPSLHSAEQHKRQPASAGQQRGNRKQVRQVLHAINEGIHSPILKAHRGSPVTVTEVRPIHPAIVSTTGPDRQQKKRQNQTGVGVPGPGQTTLLPRLLPVLTFSIDIDAGPLTGHTGALLPSRFSHRAAHRLRDP